MMRILTIIILSLVLISCDKSENKSQNKIKQLRDKEMIKVNQKLESIQKELEQINKQMHELQKIIEKGGRRPIPTI